MVMAGVEGKQQMALDARPLARDAAAEIGGLAVTRFEDLRDENGRLGPLKGATDAAGRNVLVFRFGERRASCCGPAAPSPRRRFTWRLVRRRVRRERRRRSGSRCVSKWMSWRSDWARALWVRGWR